MYFMKPSADRFWLPSNILSPCSMRWRRCSLLQASKYDENSALALGSLESRNPRRQQMCAIRFPKSYKMEFNNLNPMVPLVRQSAGATDCSAISLSLGISGKFGMDSSYVANVSPLTWISVDLCTDDGKIFPLVFSQAPMSWTSSIPSSSRPNKPPSSWPPTTTVESKAISVLRWITSVFSLAFFVGALDVRLSLLLLWLDEATRFRFLKIPWSGRGVTGSREGRGE